MLSTTDLERLIAVKRREIEKEKTRLGLAAVRTDGNNKQNGTSSDSRHVSEEGAGEHDAEEEREAEIPADLERYIRRYLGLPEMLKAGEFSPNNPLVRGERRAGDALRGLGEYERTRHTLRKLRQQQYREYLDQQAKKKQEEKEEAERQRRERERREKEREEEERERQRRQRIERERASPERPRAYTSTVFNPHRFTSKVDTGVQTMAATSALSVAVQTDDSELYRPAAERELSPRAALDAPAALDKLDTLDALGTERPQRRSAGDLQQAPTVARRRQSDSRRYQPSLLDADAISMRNAQAEQDAAAKRQCYQQELRSQIREQQRIREERRAREKMLEQAEMRRLEEQLRMLRVAQEKEIHKHGHLSEQMKENATDYEKKRTALQKEIDLEQQALQRVTTPTLRHAHTSQTAPPKPLYGPPLHGRNNAFTQSEKKPYSTNIPANSIFNPNYDVDSYLRKNLNPSKDMLFSNRLDTASSELNLSSKYLNRLERDNREVYQDKRYDDTKSGYSPVDKAGYNSNVKTYSNENLNKVASFSNMNEKKSKDDRRVVIEKALVHDRPKVYEPSDRNEIDNPIPVLRHSPVVVKDVGENKELSEAMQVVDDKWKVPVVQKNILKSLPNEEGKNVNILTQLGSIRRQLQLEQLKLDGMVSKDDL